MENKVVRSGFEGVTGKKRLKVFSHQVNSARLALAIREVPTLYIDYNDAISKTKDVAAQINRFLGNRLDENVMIGAVVPEMKRHGAAN